MARDILGEYGPDTAKPQAARATCGGVTEAKDVMDYQPPVGPIGIMRPGAPGLGGHNCGNSGSQGKNTVFESDGGAGAPGVVRLGGENKGEEGSQHG